MRLKYLQLQQDYNKQIADKNPANIEKLVEAKRIYHDLVAVRELRQLAILKNHFLNNKNYFLSSVVGRFEQKHTNLKNGKIDALGQNNSFQSMQKSVPFIGGDLLIDGIDGLSRFLAKRIKEELTLNAVENIRKYLNTENTYLSELKTVLPVTLNYLRTVEADQVLKFSDDLKQYIEQDLKNMLRNAQGLKSTERVKSLIEKYPEIDFAFEGLEAVDQISKMKNTADYFSMLENSRSLQRWSQSSDAGKRRIAEALTMSTMIAYSLTVVKDSEVRFITTDFVASYGSREDFIRLYFGFLHQQNNKYFHIADLADFVKDINNTTKGSDYFRKEVTPVAQNAERLYSQYLEIRRKNKNTEDVPYREMHRLVSDVVSFAEETVRSADGLCIQILNKPLLQQDFNDKLGNYFKIANLANNIMLDLDEKRYTTAITKTVEIPFLLMPQNPILTKVIKYSEINPQLLIEAKGIAAILSISAEPSIDKRKRIWNDNKAAVGSFAVRINADNDLQALSAFLTDFMQNPDSSLNDELVIGKITNLRSQIVQNQDKLLPYMVKTRQQLDVLLQPYVSPDSMRSAILIKYDRYTKFALSKYFLNEEVEDIDFASELLSDLSNHLPKVVTESDAKAKNKVVKMIQFVNNIAIADSPEAYEKAIESYVLPVGSSSLKEKSTSYYSLNSYPGILGGMEKSNGRPVAGFVGITAPVGLYFQPWSNIADRFTMGFFVPIIDIAAPVRLRLDNANGTQALPDFEFADILSPGFYFSLGFRNSPFSLNLGLQYGPKLRDVPAGDSSSFTSLDSYRVGIGFNIDIPLVTIFSKYQND